MGCTVEVKLWNQDAGTWCWCPATVTDVRAGVLFFGAPGGESGCYEVAREGGAELGWRWPVQGGGSVQPRRHSWVHSDGGDVCANCDRSLVASVSESMRNRADAELCSGQRAGGGSAEAPHQCSSCALGGSPRCELIRGHAGRHCHDYGESLVEWGDEPEPLPLPPVHRCPERVSAEGEAIENCDAVIGRDVQCFVCLGARCYVHCGCLQHHKGAKVIHRGGQGSFEWAVWEFEHAFRGQLYAKAADGSGLVILGTHGGASSDAVLTILLRSLERIQGRKVRDTRGEVIGQSAKARPTNEAAGELRADNDPEFELHELDAKVVLLLERSKRLNSAADEAIQKARVGVLGACTDWLRATEHVWQDFAEDPEQNPRLVWQAKELHDQQVADLFFRLGALFNGGAL